jgi:hypothetical protein
MRRPVGVVCLVSRTIPFVSSLAKSTVTIPFGQVDRQFSHSSLPVAHIIQASPVCYFIYIYFNSLTKKLRPNTIQAIRRGKLILF